MVPGGEINAGLDDIFYIGPALDSTAAEFFGGTSGGPFSLVDIDGETLGGGSSTRYRQTRSGRLGLAAVWRRQLAPKLRLDARLSLAAGQSRFFLPDGAGILAEPISIAFQHRTIGAEAGLSHPLAGRAVPGLWLDGGIGGQAARVATHISSALLDVRHQSSHGDVYAYAGLSFSHPAGTGAKAGQGVRISTRLKQYRRSGSVLEAGISLRF